MMFRENVLLILLFTSFIHLSSSEGNIIVKDVEIRPGGVSRSESIKGFGTKCRFDYTCQGGTGEKWHFSMVKSKELGRISCHIQRPSEESSYLYFQKFSLGVDSPAKVVTGSAYSEQTKLMPKEEYILDLPKNTLSQKDGAFTGHLVHASVEFEMRSDL